LEDKFFNKNLIKLIQYYQKKGGGENLLFVDCNFNPSCSEYAILSLKKYNIFLATKLIFNRLRRCKKKDITYKINDPL
tara:strand:- start:506 stop:739 length:234 start_codon:yes stop_codon:yes gene_type:complete